MDRWLDWVFTAFLTILCALIAAIWKLSNEKVADVKEDHSKRMDMINKDIGLHYSQINDLKVNYAALRTEVSNHVERFENISNSIFALRSEMTDGLRRIEDKLDNFRERRNS